MNSKLCLGPIQDEALATTNFAFWDGFFLKKPEFFRRTNCPNNLVTKDFSRWKICSIPKNTLLGQQSSVPKLLYRLNSLKRTVEINVQMASKVYAKCLIVFQR